MTNAKESYEAKILETLINNNRELGGIKKELEGIKKDIGEINNRFTQIDDRFREIDNRFNQVDNRFEQINSKLNWLFGAVFAVGTGILAAIYSAPILTALGR